MVMERHNLKRYRFLLTLYGATRLCNYAAYTPACLELIVFQHTCKLPRTLHTISTHIKDPVLAICSVCVHIIYIYIIQTEYIV